MINPLSPKFLKKFSHFWPYFNIAMLLVIWSCAPSPKSIEEADLKFELARKLYSRGQTTEALQSMQESLKINPKSAEALNFTGLIYFEKQMYPKAKEFFSKAVEVNPKFSEAYNHLCVVHTEMGQYEQAIENCHKALSNILYMTPERPYYNLAKIYEKMGDTAKVKESHLKALKFNQRFVLSLKDLGQIQYREKDYKEAVKNLSTALEVCKSSPKGSWQQVCSETSYDLALTYLQVKEASKARQAFQDCILNAGEDSEISKKCQDRLRLIK